jgi:hypothetical protein
MNCFAECLWQQAKECPREIGLVAMAQECVAVQIVDLIDRGIVELRACQGFAGQARLENAAALASRVLAKTRGELLEEMIVVAVIRGWPSETARRSAATSPRGRRPRARHAPRTGRAPKTAPACSQIFDGADQCDTRGHRIDTGAQQQAWRGRGVKGTPSTSFG